MPFDQIDWIIGTLIGSAAIVPLSLALIFTSIALAFVVSAGAHVIGYLLKLNSDPL